MLALHSLFARFFRFDDCRRGVLERIVPRSRDGCVADRINYRLCEVALPLIGGELKSDVRFARNPSLRLSQKDDRAPEMRVAPHREVVLGQELTQGGSQRLVLWLTLLCPRFQKVAHDLGECVV